jgi:hypothetical protein
MENGDTLHDLCTYYVDRTFLFEKQVASANQGTPQQRFAGKRVVPTLVANALVEKVNNSFLNEEPYVEEENSKTVLDESNLPRELAELLARHPPVDDDDGYAVFGESGDENEYDQETWDEIEAEREENRRRKVSLETLPKDEVNKTIEDAIGQLIIEWKKSKFPKVQQKGYCKWNRAAREQNGHVHIADSNFWLQRFDRSIGRLHAAIVLQTWHKAADVQNQCRSLEESVYQREEHRYYLSILQNSEPPPRPDWETLLRAKNAPRPEAPEGEEILESDPELPSDDGFIEDDISETGSIPYEAPDIAIPQGKPEDLSMSEHPASESYDAVEDPISDANAQMPVMIDEPTNFIKDSTTDSEEQIMTPARRRANLTPMKASQKRRSLQGILHVSDEPECEPDSNLDGPIPLRPTKYQKQGATEHEPIVLSSSPSTPGSQDRRHSSIESIRTPEANPYSAISLSARHLVMRSSYGGPRFDNINAIQELDWDIIEGNGDRRLALVGILLHIIVHLHGVVSS